MSVRYVSRNIVAFGETKLRSADWYSGYAELLRDYAQARRT